MPLIISSENQPRLLAAAASLTKSVGFASDAVAIAMAFDKASPVVAVAVFERFTGGSADLHLAMMQGHRMTRSVIGAITYYAFHDLALGLKQVFVQIAEDNPHALATAVKKGFQFEYRKRGGSAGGKDAIVLSLAKARPAARVEDEASDPAE